MKIDFNTIIIIAALYLFTRAAGAGGSTGSGGTSIWNGGASGFSPTNLPKEPADKKSAEWVQWVQLVILILGGLFPNMLGKGGIFGGHDQKAIVAAAFANMNYYKNPNANFPINLNNVSGYWGQKSPFYSPQIFTPSYTGGYGGGFGLPFTQGPAGGQLFP